jgi:hypothetical protein
MWLYIFASAPAAGVVFSVAFLAVAVGAYFIFRRRSVLPHESFQR